MAKLASVLAALCFLIALSHASELQANDKTSVDLDTPRPGRTDLLIQLPKAESEHPTEKQSDRDFPAELTTVTIRPADFKLDRSRPIPHSFRFPLRRGHGKPCRHGRRPLRPVKLPIDTDMVLSDENKGPGDLEGQRPFKWLRFHHQGEPKAKFGDRFEVETQFEVNGMDRPHHHHHHHRFQREEDDEENDGHHYHYHHHHRHHDHNGKEAGFLDKIRKFLTHGF